MTERQYDTVPWYVTLKTFSLGTERKFKNDALFVILPFLYCLGIITGKILNNYPIWITIYTASVIVLGIIILPGYKVQTLIIAFFLTGGAIGKYYFSAVNSNVSRCSNINYHTSTFNATIDKIIYGRKSTIYVSNIFLQGNGIRLDCKAKIHITDRLLPANHNLLPHDKIVFTGNLYTIPKPLYPNTYYTVDAINMITLQGYSKAKSVVKTSYKFTYNQIFPYLRNKIIEKTLAKQQTSKRKDGYGIILALLLGISGYISNETLEYIRRAGFAHLLAISGLHMAAAAGTVFLLLRKLLCHIPRIALYYNTKKIAAVIAILFAIFYMEITNMSVSVWRSVIMFSLSTFAVLIDRVSISIRLWGLALILIVGSSPAQIFSPALHMSFIATLVLIALYSTMLQNPILYTIHTQNQTATTTRRIFLYIYTTLLTSIFTAFVTMFYEMYHFGKFSIIGIISNHLSIPFTEFILLPLCFITLILMLFGLENLIFPLTAYGGEILCSIANYFSSFEFSNIMVKKVPSFSIIVESIGLVLPFSMVKRKIVIVLSVIFIATGLIYHRLSPMPILIAIPKPFNIIYRATEDGKYYAVAPLKRGFLHKVISSNIRQNHISYSHFQPIKCKEEAKYRYCIYETKNLIAHIFNPKENNDSGSFPEITARIIEICSSASNQVSLTSPLLIIANIEAHPLFLNLNKCNIVNNASFVNRGLHVIYAAKGKFRVQTSY